MQQEEPKGPVGGVPRAPCIRNATMLPSFLPMVQDLVTCPKRQTSGLWTGPVHQDNELERCLNFLNRTWTFLPLSNSTATWTEFIHPSASLSLHFLFSWISVLQHSREIISKYSLPNHEQTGRNFRVSRAYDDICVQNNCTAKWREKGCEQLREDRQMLRRRQIIKNKSKKRRRYREEKD